MSNKRIALILLIGIVAVELLLFVMLAPQESIPTDTKKNNNGLPSWFVTDNETKQANSDIQHKNEQLHQNKFLQEQTNHNVKFAIIIISTLALGSITILSLKNE
jgi:hypothetical protein